MKYMTIMFSAFVLVFPALAAASGGAVLALAQLQNAVPRTIAAAPVPENPQYPLKSSQEWEKYLVKDTVPAKEPLTGDVLPDGAASDPMMCGGNAEYSINFAQMIGGIAGARAVIRLSFDYLCNYPDGGRYIGNIKVKALKASSLPRKFINVEAELPPTSITNCARPGEPLTACIDLVFGFTVTPIAGHGFHYAQPYTLSADGTLTTKSGVVLQPGAVDNIVR